MAHTQPAPYVLATPVGERDVRHLTPSQADPGVHREPSAATLVPSQASAADLYATENSSRLVLDPHPEQHGNPADEDASTRQGSPTSASAEAAHQEKGQQSGGSAYDAELKANQKLLQSRGIPPTRSIALAYKNLSVRGTGSADDVTYAPTVGSIIFPWTARRYKKRQAKLSAARKTDEQKAVVKDAEEEALKKGERFLVRDFNGVIKPGEMMLVVGRPGSGCTTFLKALSGLDQGYAGVDGKVYYGSMDSAKALRPYKSDVVFNAEEDIHDPNLLVGQTMDFALRNNTPAASGRPPLVEGGEPMSASEYRAREKGSLLKVFGLEHTHGTKVGDQYVRGVSGGEKKRVSIAEVLTAKASVQMWDNATRGLDADTALRYTKVIRTLCDVERNAAVITVYQAGNGIYDCFDKVTVIAEGRVIYYGPRQEARGYFEELGFVHPDGGNTADFLTSVTATNERQIREGYKGMVPTTAAEFADAYNKSDISKRMHHELDQHLADAQLVADTKEAQSVIQSQKEKYAIKGFPERSSYVNQVKAALIRDYQQRWGDQWTFWGRQVTTFLQAWTVGSIFYAVPATTGGLFLRGGVLTMALVFACLMSLSETTAAFSGRAVLAKHKAASMYRPSAVFVATTIGDLPIFFVQMVIYTIIIYFLAGLKVTAGHYFTFFLFVYVCLLTTTALFRLIGYSFATFNDASKFSGLFFSIIVIYGGYTVYAPFMKPWFAWIRWINPLYYSFEAVISQELDGLQVQCAAPQLAPFGPGYEGLPAGCAIAGAAPGSTILSGTAWLQQALQFDVSHIWRNFGFLVALWFLFMLGCAIAMEMLPAAGSNKATLLYKPGGGGKFIKRAKQNGQSPKDEEEGGSPMQIAEKGSGSVDKVEKKVHAANTVFTWKDLSYTVQAGGKPLLLLDNIFGYCKAGTLTALMGSSGAGKTTLMDVLAARKTDGEISGEVLMNGRPLSVSFQRTTGYCEQVDVHLPQATVREALEFSALLRQPRSVPDKEKLAYVDTIIDLLELHDIEDALIGTPGAGLGVEQRKRLTIGVELVSKPTLLFLDEPTSGLDGQSSFLIVQFLRKLTAAGQAILCTIHQPSASLFSQFDNLLLLKRGGKTVYFGAINELNQYFSSKGVDIPKDVNPAERMIDIVSGSLSKGRNWDEEWVKSPECKERFAELEQLKKENEGRDDSHEDDHYQFASTHPVQLKLVLQRASVQLWRDTEYVINKVLLHIITALFNGFSFWMIGNSYGDLQNRIFTIFNFIFVAPGVIAQLQPKFIANRDIFETREKKAKIYSWWAFCFGEIIAEAPYLMVCAFLYFAIWYAIVGFSYAPYPAGPVYLQMTIYQFLYTGIGQFIAAYAPNAVFAALVNPLLVGTMVLFCGVLVPYSQMTVFWRYWLYYINPFSYMVGGVLNPVAYDVPVRCLPSEFGVFDPPAGQTCGAYMSGFLQQATGYLDNPDATSGCRYCGYEKGSEYLQFLNLGRWIDGWKNICITLLFVISSYAIVFLLFKLRTKQSKMAK